MSSQNFYNCSLVLAALVTFTICQAQCHAQGPSLSHSDNVANLYIPETGKRSTDVFLWCFSKRLYFWTQWRFSQQMTMVLPLHLGQNTRQDLALGGDISSEEHFLSVQLLSVAFLGVMELRLMFLQYQRGFSFVSFSRQPQSPNHSSLILPAQAPSKVAASGTSTLLYFLWERVVDDLSHE